MGKGNERLKLAATRWRKESAGKKERTRAYRVAHLSGDESE
jgi:hypothetical protein